MTGLLLALVWWYAHQDGRLLERPLDGMAFRWGLLRLIYPSGVFLLSITIALWNAEAARWSWLLLVPLYVFTRFF